jgi:hypothetical protein
MIVPSAASPSGLPLQSAMTPPAAAQATAGWLNAVDP